MAMGPTNLISLFYKLVCQDPQYPNDNIATVLSILRKNDT